jgi:GAF domain-containing protein
MPEERLSTAVAAAALGGEDVDTALLRSIVQTARSLFAAKAASILLLDEEANALVFEAADGEGGELVGSRFSASKGIAGWVVTAGQPLMLDDVANDPRFSRETAESTGYVPRSLIAVPLLREDRSLGVLEVLDRADESSFGLHEMELLELFADQAAIALDIVQRARTARRVLEGSGELAVVARLASAVDRLEGPRREAGFRALAAIADVIAPGGLGGDFSRWS